MNKYVTFLILTRKFILSKLNSINTTFIYRKYRWKFSARSGGSIYLAIWIFWVEKCMFQEITGTNENWLSQLQSAFKSGRTVI